MPGFKTIDVDDLKVGMYVVEIIRQDGDLAIKSSGTIPSAATIELFVKKGVKRLIIDPGRCQTGTEQSTSAVETITASEMRNNPTGNDLAHALQLHNHGLSLQKRIHQSVKKNKPFNSSYASEFTDLMVDFIESNPNTMGCAARIRKKDSYLLEHALNVSIHLIEFAQHLDLPVTDVQDLGLAGFLIDVGKIRIPDEILLKPGKVSGKEMEIIKGHVELGEEYLKQQGYPEKIIRIVSQHHERLDGSGYPRKLKGDEISQFARMVAIVDTYDAVTADRPYRAGITHQQALKILLSDSQARLDTTLVQQFIKCTGIFPEGTLVELSNGHLAMVFKENKEKPLLPAVKPFYSIKSKHYLAVKELDLAKISSVKIVKQVKANQLDIDLHKVFHEKLV